jgi:DNA modification methylase
MLLSLLHRIRYFQLRDYGYEKQIGFEKTPNDFVNNLASVFRACKKILRDDGTLWLNIGDSFSQQNSDGYKRGDMYGIPWLLAFALQRDGWYLKRDIIWQKPNPIPSGNVNKPINSHEYIFLLSKNQDYYYDAEAIKENSNDKNKDGTYKKRHKRDVWTVPVASFKGSHFAVFPTKLIEPCVLASTSEHGCCAVCSANYVRLIEKKRYATRPAKNTKIDQTGLANRDSSRHLTDTNTIGWKKNCICDTDKISRCTILDPFCGSATTGVVALQNRHNFIGIDGKQEYLELAKNRLSKYLSCVEF